MASRPYLLWDFDGTLAHREGLWAGAIRAAVVELGVATVDVEAIRAGLHSGFPWHRADVGHEHVVTAEAWWDELLPVLRSAAAGAGVPEDLAMRAGGLARTHYLDPAGWTVYADAAPALRLAGRLGWHNAILSNHVPELRALVTALGLGPYFDAVLSSAELGWEKPNPRIFELALDRLGRPTSAWMIGDSRSADYEGAWAAGLPAVLIERGAGCPEDPLMVAVNQIGRPSSA